MHRSSTTEDDEVEIANRAGDATDIEAHDASGSCQNPGPSPRCGDGPGGGDIPEALPSSFRPIHSVQVDLDDGLNTLVGNDRHQEPDPALVLVRWHGQPLGFVGLDLSAANRRSAWISTVETVLGESIATHAASDGQSRPASDRLWVGRPTSVAPNGSCCSDGRLAAIAAAPKASVVIATRERPESLVRCLDSVLRLDYPDFEVLVVDNAPETEATERLLRERYGEYPSVRYLREPRKGLASAHNCALEMAKGSVVAFTDDDVIVDRHWLAELIAPMVGNTKVVGSTGLIVPAELETPAQVLLELQGNFSKGFKPRLFDLGEHRPHDPLFPFTAGTLGSGANMAFSTELLRSMGGFDSALGTGTVARGGDDLAAFFSLIIAGKTLAYRPGAIVWHHHRRDDMALRNQAYSYGVGLGAFLASAARTSPLLALARARELPAILARARGTDARENPVERALASLGNVPEAPLHLDRLRLKGVACGPFAYARSLRAKRDAPARVAR